MIEKISEKILKDWKKLVIGLDENYFDDCRECDCLYENVKLDFRKNRDYKLPHELWIDFWELDCWELDIEEKMGWYYWNYIDCYIHSGYYFSLSGEWMNCRRDTARKCGIIAIEKQKLDELWISENEFFHWFMNLWNKRWNWEFYCYELYTPHVYTDENWNSITMYDYEDGCWWYFEIDDILSEFKDELE